MEENKFEKQVQQKMDELKIHPSDSVWKKIQIRIEKKKRSNRELFFFFLIFCVFIAGGYFLWSINHRSIDERNVSKKANSEKNTNVNSLKENKNTQAKININPGAISEKNNAGIDPAVKQSVNRNSSRRYKLSYVVKENEKTNSGGRATIVLSKQEEIKDEVSANDDNKPSIVHHEQVQVENAKIEPGIADSIADKLNKESLLKHPFLNDDKAKVKDSSKQMASAHKSIKHLNRNKWKAGVLISGGISRVNTSFLNEDKSSANSYPVTSGSGPGIISSPSATKASFGFIIGVFAERSIFHKTKLELGISFKSFKTSNEVGIKNDTTGYYNVQALNAPNTYGTGSIYNTYSNHYNFIEFPVTLKVQVGRGKSLPLFLQGGFVVSTLISSNALQFNQGSGYYYNNNSIFNKTQIGINMAFSAALFSKQKVPVLIGPYFYYAAARLANEGLYNKKHFAFTGLRTEIIFGK